MEPSDSGARGILRVVPVVSAGAVSIGHRYDLRDFEPNVIEGQYVRAGEIIGSRRVGSLPAFVNVGHALHRNGGSTGNLGPGSVVAKGEVLAETSGRFGLGRREIRSPVSGTVQVVVQDTGLLIIRPDLHQDEVRASFPGTVTQVTGDGVTVEIHGRAVRAMIGSGPEVSGRLGVVSETESASDTLKQLIDAEGASSPRVLAFQGSIDLKVAEMVRDAYSPADQIAIVGPTVRRADFTAMTDGIQGMTIVAVGGFGDQSFGSIDNDPVWSIIAQNQGNDVILLPDLPDGGFVLFISSTDSSPSDGADVVLRPGLPVRFLRGLQLAQGTVVEILEGKRRLPSGYVVDAALVAIEGGGVELIARDNLEVLSSAPVG